MDLEGSVFFDMDTAVPLGMIVNELISNSLKYAFTGRQKGAIQIKLLSKRPGHKSEKDREPCIGNGTGYTLIVSDDGTGVPENIDFGNPDTLGLRLVSILVDQLDGKMELKRDRGTEFKISFNVKQS